MYSVAPTDRSSSSDTESITLVMSGASVDDSIFDEIERMTRHPVGDCHGLGIGQQRLEGLADLPGQRHIPAAGLLVDQQRLHGGLLQGDELEPLGGGQVGEVDVVGFAETPRPRPAPRATRR